MIANDPSADDQPLVHQFIRRFGRRPTPEELARYMASQHLAAQPPLHESAPARIRHRLARVILRA